MAFPVSLRKNTFSDTQRKAESSKIPSNSNIVRASPAHAGWASVAPAAIAANAFVDFAFITPTAGRMYVIDAINILTTGDCFLHLNISRVVSNDLAGSAASTILLDGMLEQYVGRIDNASGGMFTFRFDRPLILQSGDRAIVSYYRNSTTGINTAYDVKGMSLTDDVNYQADLTMLVLGDSISGVTAEDGGLKSGLWPEIVKQRWIEKGKDIRLVNIGQGGTNTNQWDWWIKQGRIDQIKADVAFINVGMNDAASTAALQAGNGSFKTGLTNITKKIVALNPRSKIVINGITQTDKALNLANVAAYRAELTTLIQEMKQTGMPVTFADTSTAYLSSNASAYVTTEQAAGNRLHPNTKVGQPAMANVIWDACQKLL